MKAIGKQATQKLKVIVGQDATQEVKKQINRLPAKELKTNQVRGKSNKVSKCPAAPVSVADQPMANPVVNVPHTATTPSVGRRRRRRRKYAARRSTSRRARISRRTRSRRHIFM